MSGSSGSTFLTRKMGEAGARRHQKILGGGAAQKRDGDVALCVDAAGFDEPVGVGLYHVIARGQAVGAGFQIVARWLRDVTGMGWNQRQADGPAFGAVIGKEIALSGGHETQRQLDPDDQHHCDGKGNGHTHHKITERLHLLTSNRFGCLIICLEYDLLRWKPFCLRRGENSKPFRIYRMSAQQLPAECFGYPSGAVDQHGLQVLREFECGDLRGGF